MEELSKINSYLLIFSNILSPIFYEGFLSMYSEGTTLCDNSNILLIFQSILKNIPDWDDTMITTETTRIINVSNFTNLQKLFKILLKLHLENLTTNHDIINNNINIEFKKFIHICYITISKELYQYPDLFHINDKDSIKKRDMKISIINIIKNCIELSILKLLPLDILIDEELLSLQKTNIVVNSNSSIKPKVPVVLSNNMNDLNINSKNNLDIKGGSISNINLNNSSDKNNYTSTNSSTRQSTNSYISNSYNQSSNKNYNRKPKLINDSIIESAYSNLTTNTNAIINKIKNDQHVLISDKSQKRSDKSTIRTINQDTSISYNIDNDNNYVSVFNNN
tara:strand:+ start:10835 stop:11845 length:1011 start_codon:yes stop_codon:yes gene_type:complete